MSRHFLSRLSGSSWSHLGWPVLGLCVGLAGLGSLSGCSSDETTPQASGSAGAATCDVGVPLADGSCESVGVPQDQCAAGFSPDGKQGCTPVLPQEDCAVGTLAIVGKTDCQPVGVVADQCAAGFVADGQAGCSPVLPSADCPEGTKPSLGSTDCHEVGVSAGMGLVCSTGFASDGAGGCDAVLPTSDCALGEMATPGEVSCHPPQACGVGTWGDIPVDATTQYVDAAYVGGSSDGTSTHPWTTITDALSAAAAGGVIAIAAGNYAENISITKGVKLWGVCPSKVSIDGVVSGSETVAIHPVPSGQTVEVHGVAVTGLDSGIYVLGATGVTLSGIWVHDTGGEAVGVAVGGLGELTITDSLFEALPGEGLLIDGSTATLSRTVIRNILPQASDQKFGRAIEVDDSGGNRGSVSLSYSVIDACRDRAVYVAGSDATLDHTLIRGTLPRASDDTVGMGIYAKVSNGLRANLTVVSSVIEKNQDLSVFVLGSDADISQTVVRDTFAQSSDSTFGMGVVVREDGTERGVLNLRSSLIDNNRDCGVFVVGSDATIEQTVVRNTRAQLSDSKYGEGIEVIDEAGQRGNLSVTSSVLDNNTSTAISVLGSDATVESSVIRATRPSDADSSGGQGILVYGAGGPRASLTLRSSLIDKNHSSGLYVLGSDATVEDSTILATSRATGSATPATGVDVQNDGNERGKLVLKRSLIDDNDDVGLDVLGSDATVNGSLIRGTLPSAPSGAGVASAAGVFAQNDVDQRANLTLSSSMLDRNAFVGLYVLGSEATLQSSVIRDTQPVSSGENSAGIGVVIENDASQRGKLSLTDSLIDDNCAEGMHVFGAELMVQRSIVRNTKTQVSTMNAGQGLTLQNEGALRATAHVIDSLIDNNRAAGVVNLGSELTLQGATIRNTQSQALDNTAGLGVIATNDGDTRALVALSSVVIDGNRGAGIAAIGAEVTVDGSVLRNTKSTESNKMSGYGILLNHDGPHRSALTMTGSLIDQNHLGGLLVAGSDATVHSSVISNTQPSDLDARSGRGISVQSYTDQRATLLLTTSLIDHNHDIGLSVFDADATVQHTLIQNTQVRSSDQKFGDGVAAFHSEVTLEASVFRGNARASVSNFGSNVSVLQSEAVCSPILYDQETLTKDATTGAAISPVDGVYVSKQNVCVNCDGDTIRCVAVSEQLEAPEPLPPLTPATQ